MSSDLVLGLTMRTGRECIRARDTPENWTGGCGTAAREDWFDGVVDADVIFGLCTAIEVGGLLGRSVVRYAGRDSAAMKLKSQGPARFHQDVWFNW